jgi:hypothetical protein
MKLTIRELRKIVAEAKIKASDSYMKKERVREELQALIASKIASGDLLDQASLDAFMADADMSLKALKMIPFEVWGKIGRKV